MVRQEKKTHLPATHLTGTWHPTIEAINRACRKGAGVVRCVRFLLMRVRAEHTGCKGRKVAGVHMDARLFL